MSDNLPPVNPTSPVGNQISKMVKHSNANTLRSSKDITVVRGSNGTTLEINTIHKYGLSDYTKYKGEWSATKHFDVNDIVRVLPHKTYIDSSISNTTSIPATPGVWVCIVDIPDANMSKYLIQNSVSSFNNPKVRNPSVKYYPQWPEPSGIASAVNNGNGKYWELLSLLPITRTVCDENNQPVISYVDSHISGSSKGG